MHRNLVPLFSLAAGLILTALLAWLAIGTYRSAIPIAEGNLRGLALSLASAVESVADRDPSFASLNAFHSRDIAYFSLIDRNGIQVFHSNPDLIGSRVADRRFEPVFRQLGFAEERIRLGTGEEVFEYNAPVHLPNRLLALRLSLHPWRAEEVVRQARLGMVMLFALLGLAWVMGGLIYRFARREEIHRREMAHRERLAQLGEMGAVLAHEVRNPLAGIKGYAQLLNEQLNHDEIGEFASMIVTEAVRLEELVNNLLVYARQEPEQRTLIDLGELVDYVLSLVAPEARLRDIILLPQLTPGLQVSGDRDRLEQLLLNLAVNGLQAMNVEGTLTIATAARNGTVEITVTDTGPGIPAADRQRIFEPFFTTKARGSGLGLAICRKIVEAHCGTIAVEAGSDRGSVFRVTLPASHGRKQP
ncbi:sensor histidine kinase [Geotalea uraniireducens]|uniref:histidine kinase n=1 Tax=Geotalea uraniireducens TaxID=351604 RepID=A0ABM8EGE0_9BACT|nr:ATP-binding protein [Geotalea uraniireducens]BDV41479.1 sensor histidine kinase [Geotalea uraniireducens]